MCGRFMLISSGTEVASAFEAEQTGEFAKRYNIAPTEDIVAVVKLDPEPGRLMVRLRWGMVPFWAKDRSIGARLINARSETLAEKPAFRNAFRSRRALIPCNGFYEWDKTTRPKTPYLIGLQNDALFGMAAIWDEWMDSDNTVLQSCSIVTTSANNLVQKIHDRMPVIVRPERYADWLGSKPLSPEISSSIFRSFPNELMRMRAVSTKLNRAGYDQADCLEPAMGSLFDQDQVV